TETEPKKPVQESMKLVGEGMMSYLFWDVYLARLYTKSGTYLKQVSDTAIEFNYKLDIKSKALVEETINQWRELELDEHPQEVEWANALLEIWPDISEGDQLLFHIDENGHAQFYYNNQFRGEIASPEFSARFKSIWLSEDTTAPKVRKKLLGASYKKQSVASS
ncbi:MAG: chalcone isomerase family protein, partial [Gammaproteobacteria bacterium]|nr:chalcone isomerase family protein [Gammaproteobacteria bacterium]